MSASEHLRTLEGYVFDVLRIAKPKTPESLANLAKVISKLSPLLGNLIEFNTVDYLNTKPEYRGFGEWKRQDPGFPDAVFEGGIVPTPGFEIKAWFPLSTEITARFRDSQDHFAADQTYVCLLAWAPEGLVFGRPRVIDVCIVSAQSVAKARDDHYHRPPDYVVIEPEDTNDRTRNLQQTNTSGHKFQGSKAELRQAQNEVDNWKFGSHYSTEPEYQDRLRELIGSYQYRLDTNFSKMDRIEHPIIEGFKQRVLDRRYRGRAIRDWSRLLLRGSDETKARVFDEIT